MATFNAAPYLFDGLVAPTETELARIAEKDPSFYNAALAKFMKHAFYFTIPLQIITAISSNTKVSPAFTARFPFKVVGAEIGAETSGGSNAIGAIHKALAATPTTFASMQEADTDIHTAIGYMQAAVITAAKVDFAVGDRLLLSGNSSDGALVGISAVVHCYRL